MTHEPPLAEHFPAGKTARVTLELRDDLTGAAIPGALIDALTLTLFNRRSGAFLPAAPATGARQNQDILGVNGGRLSRAGGGTGGPGAPGHGLCGPAALGRGPRRRVRVDVPQPRRPPVGAAHGLAPRVRRAGDGVGLVWQRTYPARGAVLQKRDPRETATGG